MRNLVFLNHDDVRNGGSTVARSEQMAELSLRMFGPKKWNISYTSDACIRNAIVIVHKGFLERTSLGQLEAMKSANNILIADYIDIKPIHAQMRFFDAFLASSHAQAAWLKTNFPHGVALARRSRRRGVGASSVPAGCDGGGGARTSQAGLGGRRQGHAAQGRHPGAAVGGISRRASGRVWLQLVLRALRRLQEPIATDDAAEPSLLDCRFRSRRWFAYNSFSRRSE
jgi:hypothetical protein